MLTGLGVGYQSTGKSKWKSRMNKRMSKELLARSAFRLFLFLILCASQFAVGSEHQPQSIYRARRNSLANRLHGGFALLFAAPEPPLEYMSFRQDEDFYYLTGWSNPGAVILIFPAVPESDGRPAQAYREIMLLPERNLRMEQYTGEKLAADSPEAPRITGIDQVMPLTGFATQLIREGLINSERLSNAYSQQDSFQAAAVLNYLATTLGMEKAPVWHDVREKTMELRAVKDSGELQLVQKASNASVIAQRAMMKAVRPGVSERTIEGLIISKLLEEGCERPSYPSIVGSGKNSTILHYFENNEIMKSGDVVVVDAAGEYSMYASDITRTLPVNGHFTARQREIYDIVLGAQRAAVAAFVPGVSTINDRLHRDPHSLDQAAFEYMNAHGKDLHGNPLGRFLIHGLGHLVGLDVHDPYDYSKPLKSGMVFTIEPGIYIPEEKLGIRIEDVFYVDDNGKLVDLISDLAHTADEIEAAMK
jgi:Xaa-Pro aminopeptidase